MFVCDAGVCLCVMLVVYLCVSVEEHDGGGVGCVS